MTTASTAPITEAELDKFVAAWYHNLDVHAPLEEMIQMVAEKSEFRFPEVTSYGRKDFTDWYNRVTNSFFDEIHETKELHLDVHGDEGDVKLVTFWQASTWDKPEAKSKRISFNAGQTWKVKRNPDNGKIEVTLYAVDTFEPVGDSALPS